MEVAIHNYLCEALGIINDPAGQRGRWELASCRGLPGRIIENHSDSCTV